MVLAIGRLNVAAEECSLGGKVGFFAKAVVHYGERQGRGVHLLRLPDPYILWSTLRTTSYQKKSEIIICYSLRFSITRRIHHIANLCTGRQQRLDSVTNGLLERLVLEPQNVN